METGNVKINIGISSDDRKVIVEGLNEVLASTYTLYLKTPGFHWNVTGPMFNSLHLMFEKQYNEIWLSVDEIAERIRALGHHALGSAKEIARYSKIPESEGVPHWKEMTKQLMEGHEAITRSSRALFTTAEKCGDDATADLLTNRIKYHEKTAWMLRALIEE